MARTNKHWTESLLSLAIIIASSLLPLAAQTPQNRPISFNRVVEVRHAAIPTSSTCIIGPNPSCNMVITQATNGPDSTPYLCAFELAGTGQQITLADGNGKAPYNGVLGTGGAQVTNAMTWSDTSCVAYSGGLYAYTNSTTGAIMALTIKFNQ